MNEYIQLHKQTYTYYDILHIDQPIYRHLVQYHGILNSKQLWSNLLRYTSMSKNMNILKMMQFFSQSWEPGSLQYFNTVWGIMFLLSLLVVLWMKLQVHTYSNIDYDSKQIQIRLNTDKYQDQPILNLQIYGSSDLKMSEIAKLLYRYILVQCQKYQIRLEYNSESNECYLTYLKRLMFEGIVFPSILYLSSSQQKTVSKLLLTRNKNLKRRQHLNIQQYASLLKYFKILRNVNFHLDIQQFVEIFCQQIKAKLSKNSLSKQFYFTMCPESILIIEKDGKIEINIDETLKKRSSIDCSHFSSRMNQYFDRKQKAVVEKMDYWSAALCLISIIGRYPTYQYFQQCLKSLKKQQLSGFIQNQIRKIQMDRQFDSDTTLQFLTESIKTVSQKDEVETEQVFPKVTDKIDNKIPQRVDLSWLSSTLVTVNKNREQKDHQNLSKLDQKQPIEMFLSSLHFKNDKQYENDKINTQNDQNKTQKMILNFIQKIN